MTLLITGGSGSLGRHLVRQAAAAGHDVRVLSRAARNLPVPVVQGDLASGEGLRAAVADVDVVIHAASDPLRAKVVDVAGTRQLLEVATSAGVRHFVYISIVGVDAIPYPYYRRKYEAEQLVRASGLPYSIVRATQFHSLVDRMLRALARVPLVMPLPAGFTFQPVAEADVAGRLVGCIHAGPSNEVADFVGPEVSSLETLAASWMAIRGVQKRVVRIPLPGKVACAFRQGKNTAPHAQRGVIRWSNWLSAGKLHVGEPQ